MTIKEIYQRLERLRPQHPEIVELLEGLINGPDVEDFARTEAPAKVETPAQVETSAQETP